MSAEFLNLWVIYVMFCNIISLLLTYYYMWFWSSNLPCVNLTQKSKVWSGSSVSVRLFICLCILPHRPWAELDCVCGSAAAERKKERQTGTENNHFRSSLCFHCLWRAKLVTGNTRGDEGDKGWDHRRQRKGVWQSRIKHCSSSCVFSTQCVSITEQSDGRRSKGEIVHN